MVVAHQTIYDRQIMTTTVTIMTTLSGHNTPGHSLMYDHPIFVDTGYSFLIFSYCDGERMPSVVVLSYGSCIPCQDDQCWTKVRVGVR